MDKGEDFVDRNREAPVTSYDMGIYDYDIIPDPYSPKFLRERSNSEKGLNVNHEKKRKRHHCHHHHHRLHSSDNATVSTTESEPNLRRNIEMSTDSILTYKMDKDQTLRYYAICAAVGFVVIFICLTMINYYGQQLDKSLSCDRTRFNAVAYNERGLNYYLCKTLKVIRNPGISF